MYRKAVFLSLAFLGLTLLSLSASAKAQTHGRWVLDQAGKATVGFVYDVPPAEFNPIAASDAELQAWGFPPRPDATKSAEYIRWTKAVTAKRVVPELIPTNVVHGPAKNVKTGGPIQNAIASDSENWSGYAITQKPDTFYTKSGTYVEATWTVPSVAPPPGYSCGSATYASSQWVGFDGYTSNSTDVLQAGTETNCGNSDYVWYEWYPNNETEVSSPTVAAGQTIFVQVWYTTSGAPGNAYFYNETTDVVSAVAFYPPSGTTLTGNSIEWIVERPKINRALTDLVNYGSMDLDECEGDVPGVNGFIPTVNYSGTDAGTYEIEMSCPPWTPSSACTTTTVISTADIANSTYNDLGFATAGPAR